MIFVFRVQNNFSEVYY